MTGYLQRSKYRPSEACSEHQNNNRIARVVIIMWQAFSGQVSELDIFMSYTNIPGVQNKPAAGTG